RIDRQLWHCFSYHEGHAVLSPLPVRARRRDMWREHPGWLGIRDREFCLVDWNRACGNADFCDSSFTAAVLAEFHQPIRRSYDAVCCGLRRYVPGAPSWASLAGVLAVPLSQHYESVAAVPKPAGVGRLRRIDVRHDLFAVLVHRIDSGPGHSARPLGKSRGADHLRHAGYGMARLGTALGTLRDRLFAACRAGHAAGALRSPGGEL